MKLSLVCVLPLAIALLAPSAALAEEHAGKGPGKTPVHHTTAKRAKASPKPKAAKTPKAAKKAPKAAKKAPKASKKAAK
jgi:hypothetical protein